MGISTEYEQTIFDRFLSIDSGAYRDIVHFYEDYRDRLYSLDALKRFEIQACYVEALFEMGKYREVLFIIDDTIETAIVFDYSRLFGVDIYFNLLLKKAVALFQLHKTDESLIVTKQLLSMCPDEPNVRFFFKEIMLYQCRKLVLPTRVFFISGLITTTVLMAFEILIIWPFYNEISDTVTKVRNLLFLFRCSSSYRAKHQDSCLWNGNHFCISILLKNKRISKAKHLKKILKKYINKFRSYLLRLQNKICHTRSSNQHGLSLFFE
ncbi:MAG: hypothetical protein IPN87_10345 [Saprospiraceae bacterium]|nr:hypothetical protein [Candidatus Brachybacter algidus]